MARNPVASTVLILLLANGLANGQSAVTITGSLVFDGLGTLLENQTITIKGNRIETIVERSATDRSDYNLSGLTVLPGLIDTPVHLDWLFDHPDKSKEMGQKAKTLAFENHDLTITSTIKTSCYKEMIKLG